MNVKFNDYVVVEEVAIAALTTLIFTAILMSGLFSIA
jgi:hypothetical protein